MSCLLCDLVISKDDLAVPVIEENSFYDDEEEDDIIPFRQVHTECACAQIPSFLSLDKSVAIYEVEAATINRSHAAALRLLDLSSSHQCKFCHKNRSSSVKQCRYSSGCNIRFHVVCNIVHGAGTGEYCAKHREKQFISKKKERKRKSSSSKKVGFCDLKTIAYFDDETTEIDKHLQDLVPVDWNEKQPKIQRVS